MLFKEDFKKFIKSTKNTYNYALIDPPWNYNDKPPKVLKNQLTYELWSNSDLEFIFENLDVDYIFLWVTNSMIPEVFKYNKDWIYKTMITWVKTTKNGKLFYGLGNSFRNATEHLMLFQRKGTPVLRLSMRNVFLSMAGKRTAKPCEFENNLVNALNLKGLKGVYIFSGNDKKFIDCVDIEGE